MSPHPTGGTALRCTSTPGEFPSRIRVQFLMLVTCLMTNYFGLLLSSSHCLFNNSWITSKINCWQLNPYFKVCFWDNQNWDKWRWWFLFLMRVDNKVGQERPVTQWVARGVHALWTTHVGLALTGSFFPQSIVIMTLKWLASNLILSLNLTFSLFCVWEHSVSTISCLFFEE